MNMMTKEKLPWGDNENGRIICTEARAHGMAPVRRGHPAYQYMRDANGDGVVCEFRTTEKAVWPQRRRDSTRN